MPALKRLAFDRRLLAAACVCAILMIAPVGLHAAKTEYWTLATADQFLSGEIDGMAVSSRGQLRPGPAISRLASFDDPFVLSQTSTPAGVSFFGTGNEGRVYRLDGTRLEPIFTASEPEIYAVAFRQGRLLVGSSPHGKIYSVDPASGASEIFFDPEEAYIWAIEPLEDGTVVVGTGVEGRLWKIDRDRKGVVLFDSPETHIRSLAHRGKRLLAGGAGEGRIYEVSLSGSGARALFDADLTEISALTIDPSTGVAWAAAAASALPSSAPPKPEPQRPPQATAQTGGQPQSQQGGTTTAPPAPAVDVTFSFDQPVTGVGGGNSEIYRIDADGFVEPVRKLEREMIYSLSASEGGLLIGTGPLGRIYRLEQQTLSLLAALPEKQVVSLDASGAGWSATTTNAGAVYRIDSTKQGRAEFRSPVKDTARHSAFGHFRLDGEGLSGAVSSFRSGNTATPDETWSEWAAARPGPLGEIEAPHARYLQWKIVMENPTAATAVDRMTAAFVNRNVRPVIESLTASEPGVVIVGGAYPASPQVLEATNPDEYGIFASLDAPRDRADAGAGKRLFRKGYRTVSWKASDPNGDSLRYTLQFRPRGSSTWLRLRERIEESQLNFDTTQIPDGDYALRLTATDAADNPSHALTTESEIVYFTVDNTVPTIGVRREGRSAVVTVTDAASPLAKAEYSVDAEKWIRLDPEDGIVDSRQEVFRFTEEQLSGKFVTIRVVDTSWNVAAATVSP
ncbi:MAG: hypothetical protein ABR517_04550 [Thermoanaerobaculia bacterium]